MKALISAIKVIAILALLIGFTTNQSYSQMIELNVEKLQHVAPDSLVFQIYVKNTTGNPLAFYYAQLYLNIDKDIFTGSINTNGRIMKLAQGNFSAFGTPTLSTPSGDSIQIRIPKGDSTIWMNILPGDSGFVGKWSLVNLAGGVRVPFVSGIRFRFRWRTTNNPRTKLFSYTPEIGGTQIPDSLMIYNIYDEEPGPVELSSFSSSVNVRDVKLFWSTASEINNAGFEIERKLTTANEWSKLGYVAGKNIAASYTFEDRRLNSGKYNYRLKQIDNNANFKYYPLDNAVEVGLPSKLSLCQNYPNPFNPVTKIDYDLPFDSRVKIVIFDITGRELMNLVNEVQNAGYYTHQFNAGLFSSGTYFYRLEATGVSNYLMTKKMVLIK